jgi:Spy/CpxP family protein refolding chaperone
MKISKNILAGFAILSILAFAGFTFAHDGYLSGRNHMGNGNHMGYGNHMGNGNHMGYDNYGRNSKLNDEQVRKLDTAKSDFYKTTTDLRNNIDQKQLELRTELNRKKIDEDKVTNIQKKLSKFKSEFDQKSLKYKLEISKIAPELNNSFRGRGVGHDSYRGRYCQ